MTKLICKDSHIVYSIIKSNPTLVLAASDFSIIFRDNVDLSEIKNYYGQLTQLIIEEDYKWIK